MERGQIWLSRGAALLLQSPSPWPMPFGDGPGEPAHPQETLQESEQRAEVLSGFRFFTGLIPCLGRAFRIKLVYAQGFLTLLAKLRVSLLMSMEEEERNL